MSWLRHLNWHWVPHYTCICLHNRGEPRKQSCTHGSRGPTVLVRRWTEWSTGNVAVGCCTQHNNTTLRDGRVTENLTRSTVYSYRWGIYMYKLFLFFYRASSFQSSDHRATDYKPAFSLNIGRCVCVCKQCNTCVQRAGSMWVRAWRSLHVRKFKFDILIYSTIVSLDVVN